MLDKHTNTLADLVAQKEELELQITEIKNRLIQEMKADNLSSYASPMGTVSFVQRKNYVFSDEVNNFKNEMEGQLAKMKNKEKKTGVAEVEVTEFIQFKKGEDHVENNK
jgi:DNA repair ATPase RecN